MINTSSLSFMQTKVTENHIYDFQNSKIKFGPRHDPSLKRPVGRTNLVRDPNVALTSVTASPPDSNSAAVKFLSSANFRRCILPDLNRGRLCRFVVTSIFWHHASKPLHKENATGLALGNRLYDLQYFKKGNMDKTLMFNL